MPAFRDVCVRFGEAEFPCRWRVSSLPGIAPNTSARTWASISFPITERTSSAVEPPKSRTRCSRHQCRAATGCRRRRVAADRRTGGARHHRPVVARCRQTPCIASSGRPPSGSPDPASAVILCRRATWILDNASGYRADLRVGTDRIPRIADAGSSSQRRTALASDPDRRIRLLHGLRLEADIGELDMLAVERQAYPSSRVQRRRAHIRRSLFRAHRSPARRWPRTPRASSPHRYPA